MEDVAVLIADMVRAGVDADLIGRAAAALSERGLAVDVQAERRREKDRERKRQLGQKWHDLRLAVIERDGCVCLYCGEETQDIHVDHIFPLSRGGPSELSNLTVACAKCNISKKDKTVGEWLYD